MTGRRRQGGVSLIEVLVSIVIVVLGLLGLAGLQSHATVAEMEAFQRAQALVILQDMIDRINANRLDKAQTTSLPLGTGDTVRNCSGLTGVALDHCEWSNALLGANESLTGQRVGGMVGARGCITLVSPANTMPRVFEVAVVWQGMNATKEPATACGAGMYGNDRMRRAVIANVTIACLQNNPATGDCIYPPQ